MSNADNVTTTAPPVLLPDVHWDPTDNHYTGGREPVKRVVVHRWASSNVPVAAPGEKASYEGVISWFKNPASKVSAHLVFPGSAGGTNSDGRLNVTQMVGWNTTAWAEMDYNASSDDVECADDIWIGNDDEGLAVLARIVACQLTVRKLPAVWSIDEGFCRHGDLAAAGGGHTVCPVDITISEEKARWDHFVTLVQAEFKRGGFALPFGRD